MTNDDRSFLETARKILVAALVFVTPFSGMRVICLDPPTNVSTSADDAEDRSDCERLCAVQRPNGSGSGSNCALTADGSLIVVGAATAVIPVQEPMRLPTVTRLDVSDIDQRYIEPALARLNPPPEA